jgi:hypothetical protein
VYRCKNASELLAKYNYHSNGTVKRLKLKILYDTTTNIAPNNFEIKTFRKKISDLVYFYFLLNHNKVFTIFYKQIILAINE